MMHKTSVLAFSIFIFIAQSISAQTPSIYEIPRLTVYGEGLVETPADVIICYLNIYDNSAVYDYEQPYDFKKVVTQHMLILDKLGCKDVMSNPRYDQMRNYTGSGPYELKFSSQQQYEEMMNKVMINSNESMTVTLEYGSSLVSDSKRKQLEDQALEKALMDAKNKATKMSGILGVTIGTPVLVEEIDQYGGGYGYDGGTEYYSGVSGANMNVKITAKVQIQYQIAK
jgi:hypothetical protein